MMFLIRCGLALVVMALLWLGSLNPSWAFCGFYVAKADAKLFNQASQVILARNGDRTVLTMANDYQGDLEEFAIVIPVPVVLQKEQVHVGDPAIIERLDAFSAPRLVEYFDPDPCQVMLMEKSMPMAAVPQMGAMDQARRDKNESLGVTIEAQFTAGEYDILILSAKESTGLERWLTQNGYRIPANAQPLLQPYVKQGMKFFVARVNLQELSKTGFKYLRPLQIAYESKQFMLPIRLGMANAQKAQDLLVYALTPKGRVEVTNYRTVKVPSDAELPEFVKSEFQPFYTSMFQQAYERENKSAAFLEYAWNAANCDPCAAEPLSAEELRKAGVFWINPNEFPNIFVTRLHIRYARAQFPEDLMFEETPNQELFQGRYILRHPFLGQATCDAGQAYRRSLPSRFAKEAQTLAQLTGWDPAQIRTKMPEISAPDDTNWWRTLWP